MPANPLWRQSLSQRGYPRSMPKTPPRNPFMTLSALLQYHENKRLIKYPLDTAFSEKCAFSFILAAQPNRPQARSPGLRNPGKTGADLPARWSAPLGG